MIPQQLLLRPLLLALFAISMRHSCPVRFIFRTGTLSAALAAAAAGAEPSNNQAYNAGTGLLGDVMFEKYLAQEAARLSDRFLDNAKALEEWKAKRPRLRQEFLDMIGLWSATTTEVATVTRRSCRIRGDGSPNTATSA